MPVYLHAKPAFMIGQDLLRSKVTRDLCTHVFVLNAASFGLICWQHGGRTRRDCGAMHTYFRRLCTSSIRCD